MNKMSFLLLMFFPFLLLAQQLECCESVEDVEAYLNGSWERKDNHTNRQYHFEFFNGKGIFLICEMNENGKTEEIKDNYPTLKILTTNDGYEIEHDFGVLKTYSRIKYLDSITLIVTRRNDEIEKVYSRILQ